jgi:hypothetical protein
MKIQEQIAKHLREFYSGGNWTDVNLKSTLKDVTWQQATTKVYSFNTIAVLMFHINYYISAVTKVLQGESLSASDKYCFDCPPILNQKDWEDLMDKSFADAENFAALIEQMPEPKLWETFTDEKYGIYYKNLTGIIEHCHYHLGQIVLIKKILLQQEDASGKR